MSKTAEEKMLLDILKRWQRSENAAVALSARVMENTTDPLIRLVMEVIQSDSIGHHRLQQMIVDDVEGGTIAVPTEEAFEKVWQDLSDAIEIETKFIDLGKSALDSLRTRGHSKVQQFLLDYLILEEKKHKFLLEEIRKLRES